jgi:hypothetical protein
MARRSHPPRLAVENLVEPPPERTDEEKRLLRELALNASVVTYPGYNPAGPYGLPPVNGAQTSQRKLIERVLKANGHTLQKYGVKRDLGLFTVSKPMQLFLLDAFWWLFLEHFSAIDFGGMAERTRRDNLVTETEVLTYMGGTSSGTQPKRPMKAVTTRAGAASSSRKLQGGDGELPAHLTRLRGRLRNGEDVVRCGTPSLSEVKLATLSSVLGGKIGVAVDSDDEASLASTSNLEYSPRSDVSSVTRLSDISYDSVQTVDGLLRVTNFPMTFPSLTRLPPEVRTSVVAREQHQLFTRMAAHYAQAVQQLAPKHFTIKDAITRLLPDVIAQTLFAAFWESIPYATQLFEMEFQRDVAATINLWIGGVVKTVHTRNWPIHHTLNTIYKKPLKRQGSSVSGKVKDSTNRGAHSARLPHPPVAVRAPHAPPSSMKPARSSARLLDAPGSSAGGSVRDPVLSGRRTSRIALLDTKNKPVAADASNSLVGPTPPTGTNKPSAAGTSTGGFEPPRINPLTPEEEEALTPDERRQRSVNQQVAMLYQDMSRIKNTHTFSQAHYQRSAVGRAAVESGMVAQPFRTANVHQLGPQKRTVQVIKQDLDAKYRGSVPWYGNPKQKVRLREQTGTAKFALYNWSPLLHRFMLSNGADNPNRPESIRWTTYTTDM